MAGRSFTDTIDPRCVSLLLRTPPLHRNIIGYSHLEYCDGQKGSNRGSKKNHADVIITGFFFRRCLWDVYLCNTSLTLVRVLLVSHPTFSYYTFVGPGLFFFPKVSDAREMHPRCTRPIVQIETSGKVVAPKIQVRLRRRCRIDRFVNLTTTMNSACAAGSSIHHRHDCHCQPQLGSNPAGHISTVSYDP